MSTKNEEFNVKRSAFPRKAKEQTLINKETITVIMEVLEANNAVEENLRVTDYKLHQTNKRVNYEKKVHNKTRSAKKIKEANPVKKTNAKECSKHHLTDFVEQNYDIRVAKSKEPVLQSSKLTGGLSYVMKLEERKDLLSTTPMTDPLGPDTFENFQWVGIKQEPPDDVEVSKVVLTELPLRSVFQESTAPDALRESTPPDALRESTPPDALQESALWSPAQIDEDDSRTQDTQTDDDDNLDQDPFFEGNCTKEEECPNPEEISIENKRKNHPQDCDVCGKKLSSKGSLRLHKWKKHKEKVQFSCDLCGDKFDFQKEVIKHRNATHRQEDGRFSCGMCSKRFIEYHSLSIHLKNHHSKQQETGGSNKTCTDCHESFDSEEGLKAHQLLLHGASETDSRGKLKNQEKNFICDTCGRRFAFNCLLRDHTNLHTGTKPYLCQECGKSFALKATLKQHSKTHNDTRPFQCLECPIGFFNKGDLKKHTRKHTGERPYVCEVCGEAFSRSTHLGVHRRSHTGERPFSCDICQRGFTKRGDVVRHRRIHTGELPYLCQICGKAYRQSTQCSNHIKNQHPGAPLLITKCTYALLS